MLTADHLLQVIDAYRVGRKLSDSRVSAFLFNDGKRVGMLRKGGDVGSRPLVASFQWLSDHWPDAAVWPADVPRPSQAPIAANASTPHPEAMAS